MTIRTWQRTALESPAMVAATLPKIVCPICAPVYAAALSSLGIGFLTSTQYLLPLTTALLTVAMASLFVGARYKRRRAPFWIGVGAAAFVVMGKFVFDAPLLTGTGIGLLVIASIWNAVPNRTNAQVCRACVPTTPHGTYVKEVSKSDGTHD